MLQTSDHLQLDRLLRETIAYVHTILDASFVVETNEHNGQLPLFLEERYVLVQRPTIRATVPALGGRV